MNFYDTHSISEGAENALAELYKFSPVAWQHIYLIGKYIFDNSQSGIDLTTVLADLISRLAA